MLDLKVTIEGDKVVINNLQQFAAEMPQAVQRGMSRSVKGMHRVAYDFLSGAAGASGAYPVPVRTGNLRRLLDFVEPGQSKGEFTTGPMEAILYDSALYARLIHDAAGSSAKFGKRPYLTDALAKFNEGDRIAANIKEEIGKEITRRGM